MIIAVFAIALQKITDSVCTATVCRATSNFLMHTHATGWFFLAILSLTKFQQIKAAILHAKTTIEFFVNNSQNGKAKKD